MILSALNSTDMQLQRQRNLVPAKLRYETLDFFIHRDFTLTEFISYVLLVSMEFL